MRTHSVINTDFCIKYNFKKKRKRKACNYGLYALRYVMYQIYESDEIWNKKSDARDGRRAQGGVQIQCNTYNTLHHNVINIISMMNLTRQELQM